MKRDTTYIAKNEALLQEMQADLEKIPGFVQVQEIPEGQDFGAFLKNKGILYEERAIHTVGTWEDLAHELHYRHPEHGDRYAYVLNFRYEIDAWGQTVYLFSQRVPDEHLAESITLIRQQETVAQQRIVARQLEIDQAFPAYWRLINFNWEMSILAYSLIRWGWTPQVEQVLNQWGAYRPLQEGVGIENKLVQSLLAYGKLIKALEDPGGYIREGLAHLRLRRSLYEGLILEDC